MNNELGRAYKLQDTGCCIRVHKNSDGSYSPQTNNLVLEEMFEKWRLNYKHHNYRKTFSEGQNDLDKFAEEFKLKPHTLRQQPKDY